MKRLIGLILAGLAVAGAVVLPEPEPGAGPDFVGPEVRESAASTNASVWYCPWVASGALRDSVVMLAATNPVDGTLTLPQQIPGEEPDIDEVSIEGAGALVVSVGEIIRRGDTPLFVEFDNGPAAAAAVVSSAELLTGDTCVARIPKVWQLPGGTTREGRTLTLRLFNPFPELAKVSVGGSSESGETGLLDLQNLDVAGRTWQDVTLNEVLPLLDELSLTVTSSEGFVIPSLVLAGTTDEASWPGIAPANNWEFPVATTSSDFAPSLMLSNANAAPVVAFIDVFTDQGVTVNAREVEVLPNIPSRVPLGDLADGAQAVRVHASAPLAAVVVAEESDVLVFPTDEEGQLDSGAGGQGDRIAGTIGATSPATSWLLPGMEAVPQGDSTLWILNSGATAATVTLQPLGVRTLNATKVSVPAATQLGVPLGYDGNVGGYLVEASTPVSVAWSVESPAGLMFVAGTVVRG